MEQETQFDPSQKELKNHFVKMVLGYVPTPLIYVAAKLGIADLLKEGPKTVDELAQAVNVIPRNLYRVLRALASIEIFSETQERKFMLTPLAEFLRSDVPDSQRYFAVMHGEEWWWRPWREILHTVQTGETGFEHIFNMQVFQYLKQNREAGEIFDAAMSTRNTREIATSYDFSGITNIVDIGGGTGLLISSILKNYPHMQGVLFDLPEVIKDARTVIESRGISNRCRLEEGSFFETIPSGGDAYIMRSILHDWDDEQAMLILNNCRKAIHKTSKLLILDYIVPSGNSPSPSKLSDIAMMALLGGAERTELEFKKILNATGFKIKRILSISDSFMQDMSIIEAIPI